MVSVQQVHTEVRLETLHRHVMDHARLDITALLGQLVLHKIRVQLDRHVQRGQVVRQRVVLGSGLLQSLQVVQA